MQTKGYELKRVLNSLEVAALTVSTMVGAGIFTVSGLAMGKAGPSVLLSVVIAALVALMTALVYAELASAYPRAGGAYAFTRLAFRGRLEVIPFLVGAFVILELVVGGAVITSSWAEHMAQAVPLSPGLLRCVPPLFVLAVGLWGIKESSWANIVIVLVKLLTLAGFAVSALPMLSADRFVPFMPGGITGMLFGAAVFFFAFVGFEIAASVAGDVVEPEKTMPRGLLLGFVVVTILYVVVMAGIVSTVTVEDVAGSGSPLAVAAARTLGETGAKVLSLLIIFALLSTLIAGSIGASRILYAMASDSLLPQVFGRVNSKGTPVVALVIMTLMWGVLSQVASIGVLANVLNFGTLAAFLFVNLALFVLRSHKAYTPGRFQVPLYPITPTVGALSSFILLMVLDRLAVMTGLIYATIVVLYYYLLKNKRGEVSFHEHTFRAAQN